MPGEDSMTNRECKCRWTDVATFALLVAALVLFTGTVSAQGMACSQCPPGNHWIHNPPSNPCGPGTDMIANSGAVIGIDTDFDCVRDLNFVMRPCPPTNNLLHVDKTTGPIDDSGNFPGTRPVDGHMDVVDTEIVSMCLTSAPITLVAGTGGPSLWPLLPTLGTVAELPVPADGSLADSSFDVFFEVQGAPGGPLYNLLPVRVQSQVTCLPPADNYYHPVGMCIPLYSKGTCQGGPNNGNPCVYDANCPGGACVGRNHMANAVSANHSINQPVCETSPFPQCQGNCPPNEFCVQNPPPQSGCHCEPIPCEASPSPECGGDCGPDQVCRPGPPGAPCECVPRCEFGPVPCQGPCPDGQICVGSTAGTGCACQFPCEQGPFPECAGGCPPGLHCQPDNATGKCECVPDCPQSPQPECDGFCPPDSQGLPQICRPGAVGAPCTCVPRCEQSPFPQCQGPCPAPLVCEVDPNNPVGACICVQPHRCEDGPYPSCPNACPPGTGLECLPDNTGLAQCVCRDRVCEDGPYPTCSNSCPPGLVCRPNAAGQCTCVQPQVCEDGPYPSCPIACTTPGLVCRPDTTGHCVCRDPICEDGPYPQCSNPCPPGLICRPNAATGQCTCVQAQRCEDGPFPSCPIACPAGSGLVCRPDPLGTPTCVCRDPFCEDGPYPTCSNPCPQGQICKPNTATGQCNCVDPVCQDGPYPTCNNPCPPGLVCIADDSVDPSRCICVQPPRCEQGPYPECNKPCPTGFVCRPDATTGRCRCVAIPPPCAQAVPPQCGGICPPNNNCQKAQGANNCLCCPGIITDAVGGVKWDSKTIIKWIPWIPPCPVWYNLYRHQAVRLTDADMNGVADNYGPCGQHDLQSPEATETDNPPDGEVFFYNPTAENSGGEGPMGNASNGRPRPLPMPPCP